jgi:hypothetical protein
MCSRNVRLPLTLGQTHLAPGTKLHPAGVSVVEYMLDIG